MGDSTNFVTLVFFFLSHHPHHHQQSLTLYQIKWGLVCVYIYIYIDYNFFFQKSNYNDFPFVFFLDACRILGIFLWVLLIFLMHIYYLCIYTHIYEELVGFHETHFLWFSRNLRDYFIELLYWMVVVSLLSFGCY